jgi:coenzyme F420-reducing hydrogenase delta subunit
MAQTPEDLLDGFIEVTAYILISHCKEQGCSLELGIKDWQDEMPEIQEKLAERVIDKANSIHASNYHRNKYDDH